MPDMTFQALDPTGLNETAEQVRAIVQEAKAEIEAELDSLSYAQPDGIYPEMTVGAVIGADETAQWATRTTEGSGSAAPVLTIAEPVNMSTELARIWAAIEALQGSRGSALESVRSDSDVSSTEVKEAPTMDEKQTTERESEV